MSPLDIDLIAPEAISGIRVMPVLHERVDLAPIVRQALEKLQPQAVAVELPTTLADAAEKAVARLPKVSVVISDETGEDALVWVVTPGDPMVEAMRWAAENERRVLLVDPDLRYGHLRHDLLPDPHSLHQIGPESYVELIRQLAGSAPYDERDTMREQGIAHHFCERPSPRRTRSCAWSAPLTPIESLSISKARRRLRLLASGDPRSISVTSTPRA